MSGTSTSSISSPKEHPRIIEVGYHAQTIGGITLNFNIETFGVQKPDSYLYTSKSNCLDVAGIDDLVDFKDTLNAMKIIGLSRHEQDNIFRMLAAILWLGNVQFREN